MIEERLKITLIQTPLKWEDKVANLKMFEAHFLKVNDTDLIILPEMFSTGFSMEPQNWAESEEGETVIWLKKWSKLIRAAITGSIIVKEDGRYYNRLFFVEPDGKVQSYSKRHLFTLAGEEKVYAPGAERIIVEYKGWRICPLVCYDLRFPVWSRNDVDFDLLIYVANWPERRNTAWNALLKARAIENQCYVAGVNRIGKDNSGIDHSGDSQLLDSLGENISQLEAHHKGVETLEINHRELMQIRSKFQFLNDRDRFTIDRD